MKVILARSIDRSIIFGSWYISSLHIQYEIAMSLKIYSFSLNSFCDSGDERETDTTISQIHI